MSAGTFGSDELAQFRRTFFEECAELLADLEEKLAHLAEEPENGEGLNAIFRAAHSIKAGAGAFGYTDLVRFCHGFEALLDKLRSGQSPCDERTLACLVAGGDVLAALVEAARDNREIEAGIGADVEAEIALLMGGPEPVVTAAAPLPRQEDSPPRRYRIGFRPNAELFRHANEPLYLIRELKTLGKLAVTCDQSRLPSLADLKAEDAYLSWTMTLETERSEADIREVFEFVDDDCDLSIMPLTEEVAAGSSAIDRPQTVASAPQALTAGGSQKTATASAAPSAGMSSIRVDLARVDRLVNMVGELVITQAMLAQQFGEDEVREGHGLQGFEDLATLTRELQECVMAIRMQPVKSIFSRMPRLVREVAHKLGKTVRLDMAGEQTEVDKTVIEELADPLTHMIRNAVDHGLESAEERLAAGKPAEGVIRLSAQHAGSNILIHVEDDGAGINRDRLLQKAIERGIVMPGVKLSGEEIDDLIFAPGFSTAAKVTDVSGRGVGLDVVRRNITSLGGRVQVQSTLGKGTRFTLVIPLTLAVLDGMVVAVGAEKYILPLTSIVESFRPEPRHVRRMAGGEEVVSIRGDFVRLVHLHRLFGVAGAVAQPAEGLVVLVETATSARLGILVDELIGQQQVVIKSLQDNFDPVPGISGATILGNGRVALIVDIEQLTRLVHPPARLRHPDRTAPAHQKNSGADPGRNDDSGFRTSAQGQPPSTPAGRLTPSVAEGPAAIRAATGT